MKKSNLFLAPCLFAGALFLTSCEKEVQTSSNGSGSIEVSNNKALGHLNYSGREIFEAVYFLKGDVVGKLNTLSQYQKEYHSRIKQDESMDAYLANVKEISDRVEKNHPEFFHQLESSINAGNPAILHKYIRKGMTHLEEATREYVNSLAKREVYDDFKSAIINSKFTGKENLEEMSKKINAESENFPSLKGLPVLGEPHTPCALLVWPFTPKVVIAGKAVPVIYTFSPIIYIIDNGVVVRNPYFAIALIASQSKTDGSGLFISESKDNNLFEDLLVSQLIDLRQ